MAMTNKFRADELAYAIQHDGKIQDGNLQRDLTKHERSLANRYLAREAKRKEYEVGAKEREATRVAEAADALKLAKRTSRWDALETLARFRNEVAGVSSGPEVTVDEFRRATAELRGQGVL